MHNRLKQIDTKEFELPDTVFVRDIENRVFQSIALQCLAKIPGIALIEGNFIDNLLGSSVERVKGIHVEQDQKNHSVSIKVEVNVSYGIQIPAIAEKIQTKLAQEMSDLTGLRVSTVHVIFKNLIPRENLSEILESAISKKKGISMEEAGIGSSYTE